VHIGAAAVPARVRVLDPDVLRLRLDRQLPLHVGDRLLLRDPGRGREVAGADVADVDPLPLTGRGTARARAEALRAGSSEGFAGAAAAARFVGERGAVPAGRLRAAGFAADPAGAVAAAGWWISPPRLAQWRDAVRRLLAASPDGEVSQQTARRQLGLPVAELLGAVLSEMPDVVLDRELLRDPARTRTADSPGLTALRRRLAADPFDAPDGSELAALSIAPRELARVAADGDILPLGSGVYVGPVAVERSLQLLAGLDQPFTVAVARQALGVTRRVAVPLLEELDRRRLTVRMADGQRMLRVPRPA